MSNANDEAAKKAAEEAAAKKAAEEAAKKAEKKAKGEKRPFKTIHNVLLAGEQHPAGATIEITREEHATLFAGGSVDGDWDD